MTRRPAVLLLGTLISMATGTAVLLAQTPKGVIEGRILSAEGAGVANATVVISDDQHEVARFKTGLGGRFWFAHLAPSDGYILQVDSEGYRSERIGPVRVPSDESIHLDVTVVARPNGGSGESSPAQPFDAASTQTSSRFDGDFINALPILGHNYQDALTLAPGVTDPDGDGSPNVHGARQTGLQYRLDGGDVTDPESGVSGINLNPLVIEEIEVITAGAPADRGRADGGFADITTRSGGNDLDLKLALFWRGRFLDGKGAGNNDVNSFDEKAADYRDFRAATAAGGPIVKDRFWYFAALEVLDRKEPADQLGTGLQIGTKGTYYFGKLTWQVNPTNRLVLQMAGDPLKTEGLGLSALTSSASGFDLEQRAVAAKLGWTATVSPDLILEAALTRLDRRVSVEPTSNRFEPIETTISFTPFESSGGFWTDYPCSFLNCSEKLGERRIYQIHELTGRVSGPYYQSGSDSGTRDAMSATLSYLVHGGLGEHHVKAGFELGQEESRQDIFLNPILFDYTAHLYFTPPDSNQVSGAQVLQTARPDHLDRSVTNFNTGLFLLDSWKPRSNVAVTAGVRFQEEDLDAPGFRPFDPRVERRRSISLWRAVCAEAVRQGTFRSPFSNCGPSQPYDGGPPEFGYGLMSYLDENADGINDVPSRVAALDVDHDGLISSAGPDAGALYKYFTTYAQREPRNFEVSDAHVSPRIGISWDPWDDGKTRLFAHWGRYYDRLLTETVQPDSDPSILSFSFIPDPLTHVIVPGQPSSAASTASISQVDHQMRAPRTDELSLGFERGLGAAWSVGATYIRRKARGLLQDTDLNHFTCDQSGEVIGIDPHAICGNLDGTLDKDRFGNPLFPGPGGPRDMPNGVEDLYVASPAFDQVLRVENLNTSDYIAYELKAVRRLHRDWQMQASYTYSRVRGQAEAFRSALGDDPSTINHEAGYLDYDQRHRITFEAVANLPYGLTLGGLITWNSGTPWSVIAQVASDADSSGNLHTRTLYPTGQRNDQRNESAWLLDGRIEKSFRIGRLTASGFLSAVNLLNSDTLVISSISADGTSLVATEDFGRRFEIGAVFGF